MSSESISPLSYSYTKSSRVNSTSACIPLSYNNPESSPSAFNRSLSPNGYQLYKQCVKQIDQQSSNSQIKSQSKVQSQSNQINYQLKTRTIDEYNEQQQQSQIVKQSFCSIANQLQKSIQIVNEQSIKQVIEYTTKIYQSKLQQYQNKHQIQIQQLTNKLKQLQYNISMKQEQFQSLKKLYETKLKQQNKLNHVQNKIHPALQSRVQYNIMKQTLDGLNKQCKDIQKKIKIIIQYKNKQINQQIINTMINKIERIEKQVIIAYGDKIINITNQLESIITKYQSKFKLMQKLKYNTSNDASQQYKIRRVNSESNDNTSFVGINVKIVQIKQQLISNQLSLKSVPDIFEMYRNQYQILFKQLKDKISKAQLVSINNKYIEPITHKQQQIVQEELIDTSFITPITMRQSTMNSPKHQIKPISSMFRSLCTTLPINSSRQILTSRNISDTYKIQRLIETLNLLGHQLPLKCTIDQTGYLKYQDSGTYIFDKIGNLFELNKQQLQCVIDMKLLKIQ